jgi:RNA polymerase sigma factor (sigma-70 family)
LIQVTDGIEIAPIAACPGSELDEGGVEQLLAELRPLVVRTVRLVVGAGTAIAEDAAQEALLEVMRSVPRLENKAAAPAWAMRIATRVALRMAQRERRRALIPFRLARVMPQAVSPPDLLALKEAFDDLPPKLRATAVLRLYVGLSEFETAEALGCPVGTVKRRLHDARRRLTRDLRNQTNERG